MPRKTLRICGCGTRFIPTRSDAEHCSDACRQRAYRKRKRPNPVGTVIHGNNADLIAKVSKVHRIADGAKVADVTYGCGTFWKKTNTSRFNLLCSDLLTTEPRHDFRNLPYDDASIDIVVFDPPYNHHGRAIPGTEHRYQNGTTKGMVHDAIMELYADGMREAVRVLKRGGQLWVKCKDEIESGRQRWSHMEIYQIADELGLTGRDLFILVPGSRLRTRRWQNQYHARKAHSYIWVMENRGVPLTVCPLDDIHGRPWKTTRAISSPGNH